METNEILTEREMTNLRSHFLNAAEHGKVIFLVMDVGGKIEYISTYVESILNFKQEELVGRTIYDVTNPVSAKYLQNLISTADRESIAPIHFREFGLYCTACKNHYFDGVLTAQETQTGRRFITYLHDVTERKIESEKLASLNLELDSFIYKASHDLRAPLLSIMGLTNLLEKEAFGVQLEYAKMIRTSIGKLDKFILQLAHYARNNNEELVNSCINFDDLFSDVIESYRFLPHGEKISFDIDTAGSVATCSDSFRLKIILNNLVSNAIKYHNLDQRDPFIKLKVVGEADSVVIQVIDNGSGIPTEKIGNIFEMFQRATDKADGSGLGLYIVQKALEKMGGRIQVHSQIDKGTTFTITIPKGNGCEIKEEEQKMLMTLA